MSIETEERLADIESDVLHMGDQLAALQRRLEVQGDVLGEVMRLSRRTYECVAWMSKTDDAKPTPTTQLKDWQ